MSTSPELSETETETQHAAEARRIRRPRDMVLSMAVLLVPILLVVFVGRFFYGDTTTATVDPELALKGAERASMQPIPAAAAPADWKIVNAMFKDGVLRIGYLEPAAQGAQLVQGRDLDLISHELGDDARPAGEVTVGGQTWARWDARGGISALTRKAGDTTIIVLGAASAADLELLAQTVTK